MEADGWKGWTKEKQKDRMERNGEEIDSDGEGGGKARQSNRRQGKSKAGASTDEPKLKRGRRVKTTKKSGVTVGREEGEEQFRHRSSSRIAARAAVIYREDSADESESGSGSSTSMDPYTLKA